MGLVFNSPTILGPGWSLLTALSFIPNLRYNERFPQKVIKIETEKIGHLYKTASYLAWSSPLSSFERH